MHCTECGVRVPDGARYCPGCGAVQSAASQLPTAVATPPRSGAPAARPPSSAGPWTPGDVLAGRYRIVGLIGRGGMGEVVRADDLKLGQPVSLKFIPAAMAADPDLLERFHSEVRHARQVAHPNVCRVYDIAEADGRHFITMEYVDGEDLAGLLRRIGRLPTAKADQVARQLCAGLAAAHDRGVLHRDLKPSNVMLDGEGRVRITDFGLAVRPGEGAGEVAGTPAYMAPEQFEGLPVTVQSDLYALGLVLYETYTGRKPFEAGSFAEWKSKHAGAAPTSPSRLEPDVDEAVERAILRCLEKDPSRRPASALQLAAALPGGDPLAAAVAAGETPSPEMVAAAGGEGALSPRAAWGLLVGLLAAMAAVVAIAPHSTDLGLSPLHLGREALRERARGIAARLGYAARPADSEAWFVRDYEPMRHLADRKPSPEWRREMRAWGTPVRLAYRQEPRPMEPSSGNGRVTARDPAPVLSGSLLMSLDAEGRLRDLEAIPPQIDSAAVGGAAPAAGGGSAPDAAADWEPLFAAAGLDRAAFVPVPPSWTPPAAFDARAEWLGKAAWAPDLPLTVSAAAWRGRPVYFEVRGPWSRPWRMIPPQRAATRRIADAVFGLVSVIVIVAGVGLARRNLALGRGDRRGAVRLAGFVLAGGSIVWLASAHHVADFAAEAGLIGRALGELLLNGAIVALAYLAVEPYVRRRIPELLIGWARLLDGRFRDPRVGRDVLVGGLLGTVAGAAIHLVNAVPTWIDAPGQTTIPPDYDALAGGSLLIAYLGRLPLESMGPALFIFGLYFLLRWVLRRPAPAVAVLLLVVAAIGLGGENPLLETPYAVLFASLATLAVARHGLLAVVAFWTFHQLMASLPLPPAAGAPYLAQSLLLLALAAAVAILAFRVAIGPRPALGGGLDD